LIEKNVHICVDTKLPESLVLLFALCSLSNTLQFQKNNDDRFRKYSWYQWHTCNGKYRSDALRSKNLEQFRMLAGESWDNRASKPNTFHCLYLIHPEKKEKIKRFLDSSLYSHVQKASYFHP